MIIVDASVMVSVFWSQDVNHAGSRKWLFGQAHAGETFIAPVLILGEVAGAITRRTGNSHIGHTVREEFQTMPGFTFLSVDESIGYHTAWLAAELHLHGADATYVAIADMLGAPLVTWDDQQRKRGSQRVMTFSPSDPDGS